jgi:uncharacterized protein (TIRG00374 family)
MLILVAIGIFFCYRWMTLGGAFHLALTVIYLAFGLLGVIVLAAGSANSPIVSMFGPKQQGIGLNIGISLVFLDLVFARLEWQATLGALGSANYLFLLPSFALVIASLFLRTWRWQWLLKPVGKIPFAPAFRAANIGIGANMVLPARAGEFLRAYVLGRATDHSKVAIFATLVVERILDGFSILLSLLIVVVVVGVNSPELQRIGMIGGLFYFAALVGMLVFYFRQAWFSRLVERLVPDRWAGSVLNLLDAFARGLHVLRDGKQLLAVCLQSILIWIVLGLSFYPVMRAFDFGAPVPLFAPFLLLPLLALGLTIPGAPGGIGITQYMGVLALQLSFAADGATLAPDFAEKAAAFSLLMHLSQAAPEIAFGLWAFLSEGLSWGDVGNRAVLAEEAEAA